MCTINQYIKDNRFDDNVEIEINFNTYSDNECKLIHRVKRLKKYDLIIKIFSNQDKRCYEVGFDYSDYGKYEMDPKLDITFDEFYESRCFDEVSSSVNMDNYYFYSSKEMDFKDFFEKFTLNQIGLNKNCNGNLQFSSKCRTSENPEIAVIGNSYAAHLISGLKENISDIKLIQFTYDGCAPFYFNDLKEKSSNNKCENFNKNVYAELNKDYLQKNLKYLIISGIENGFDNEQYKASLQKKLNFFKDNNIKIIIVGNLPLQINEVNFGRCFLLEKFKNGNFTNCNYSVGKIKPNAIVMNKKLKNFSQLNNFQYFDLINTLCPKKKCLISDINGFYINDIGHFTKHGSKIIINNLLKEKLLN